MLADKPLTQHSTVHECTFIMDSNQCTLVTPQRRRGLR